MDDIKMDFGQTRCGDVELVDLVQDRDQWTALVSMAVTLRVQ
jgi:hypothetical protein